MGDSYDGVGYAGCVCCVPWGTVDGDETTVSGVRSCSDPDSCRECSGITSSAITRGAYGRHDLGSCSALQSENIF